MKRIYLTLISLICVMSLNSQVITGNYSISHQTDHRNILDFVQEQCVMIEGISHMGGQGNMIIAYNKLNGLIRLLKTCKSKLEAGQDYVTNFSLVGFFQDSEYEEYTNDIFQTVNFQFNVYHPIPSKCVCFIQSGVFGGEQGNVGRVTIILHKLNIDYVINILEVINNKYE